MNRRSCVQPHSPTPVAPATFVFIRPSPKGDISHFYQGGKEYPYTVPYSRDCFSLVVELDKHSCLLRGKPSDQAVLLGMETKKRTGRHRRILEIAQLLSHTFLSNQSDCFRHRKGTPSLWGSQLRFSVQFSVGADSDRRFQRTHNIAQWAAPIFNLLMGDVDIMENITATTHMRGVTIYDLQVILLSRDGKYLPYC